MIAKAIREKTAVFLFKTFACFLNFYVWEATLMIRHRFETTALRSDRATTILSRVR